jgi:dihydrofolate synthase / folylpolyglutamate synthase
MKTMGTFDSSTRRPEDEGQGKKIAKGAASKVDSQSSKRGVTSAPAREGVQIRMGTELKDTEAQHLETMHVEIKANLQQIADAAPACTNMADAMSYLYSRIDLEKDRSKETVKHAYKLDRMRAILAELGDPHNEIRTVHVAGTKGKGSTCEMIAAGLEGCGYTIGIYTSPHLLDIRERIRINRRMVTEADFVRLTNEVGKAAHAVHVQWGTATFFELTTAMAFVHFAQQAVDLGVIEVGLGGLLDCTNVITPEVAAVATIGWDHMEILGDSLEKIAIQKAGIFKPGVPALAILQDEGILRSMGEYAKQIGAQFQVVGKDIDFTSRFEFAKADAPPQARVSLLTENSEYDYVPVPLPGEHMALNCGLALAVIDKLSERGFLCPEDRVAAGLERVKLAARFEVLAGSPRILLDGAHNPESIRALMKTIGQYLQYDSLIVVFGCAADKDIEPMLRAISMAADKVIFTRASGNQRAASPESLAKGYRQIDDKPAMVAETLTQALEMAKRSSASGDVVCITGSFYLVGEFKQWLAQQAAKRAASGRR